MNETTRSVKESIANKVQLTEGDLLTLAHTLGLMVVNTVSIQSQSDLGNGREFIECGLYGAGHVEYDQMVVDHRNENPHLDQVYNLAYGPSSNCRFKVILFAHEKQIDELDDPCTWPSVVKDLITYLNCRGARLYLVEATIGPAQALTYKMLIEPDFSNPKNLPFESIVRGNEFWALYFYFYDETFEVGPWFLLWEGDGNDVFSAFVNNDDTSVDAVWDESGLSYVITNRVDKNYLNAVCTHISRKLQALFQDYDMNYRGSRSISGIEFKVSDKPYDWVLYATSAQKKEMGLKIWTEMNKILQFMDHGVEDIKLNKYSKNPGLLQI
jgi:hypothetical protein